MPRNSHNAGIRLVVKLAALLSDQLQAVEQTAGARMDQAAVEEALRRGKDDAAVDVVLDLLVGLISRPHRSVAAIAGQRLDLAFHEDLLERHAVNRL